MSAEFKQKVSKWMKKNPGLAGDFIKNHLPKILKEPFRTGSKLKTNMSLYSYHFHRKPEYRAIYSIEGENIIFHLIASREDIYKDLKNIL